jgi:hypothetical protein
MALTRPLLIPGDSFTVSPKGRSVALVLSGGAGVTAICLAVVGETPWFLLGVPISLLGCLLIHLKSLTDLLIIGESAAVVRQGLLKAEFHILSLLDIHVRIRQSVMGRFLNMGTIYIHDGERRVEVAYLGDIDRLVAVLATRIGTSRILLDYRGRKP